MEPLSLYQIIDVLIKLTAGIFIVIFLNNRNNKVKKKEILYNLFLSMTECYQLIYSNMLQSLQYDFFKHIEDRCPTELELYKNTLIKSDIDKFKQSDTIVREKVFEIFRIAETIELIIGINIEQKYWKALKENFMTSIRIPSAIINHQKIIDHDDFIIHYQETIEYYDSMIEKINAFKMNYMTETEAKSDLREEAMSIALKINHEYRKDKVNVKAYINEIYNKIDKL